MEEEVQHNEVSKATVSKVSDSPEEAATIAAEQKPIKVTKKKRLPAWCWYCDREFKDVRVLIYHQRSRHFKCPHCAKRLNSAAGLLVHAAQVHKGKPPIERVPNALPGHDGGEWEIYGMEGVPEEDLRRWKMGLPMVKRETMRGMTSTGLVSILAAQKQKAPGQQQPTYALPKREDCNALDMKSLPEEEGQLFTDKSPVVANADNDGIPQTENPSCSEPAPPSSAPILPAAVTLAPVAPPPILPLGKIIRKEKSVFD